MATLTSGILFTGSVGELSAYRRKGSNKIFLRRKGGASKERVRTAPEFETTRRLGTEFGGRSTMSQWILKGMPALKSLADYPVSGTLNKMLMSIQRLDTKNDFGKRSILLSNESRVLGGLSFNKTFTHEYFFAMPIRASIEKKTQTAKVVLPLLTPGVNFRPSSNYSFYNFISCACIVPDLIWSDRGYVPSDDRYNTLAPAIRTTEWYSCIQGSEEYELILRLPEPPDSHYSIFVAVGIRFGTMVIRDFVQPAEFGSVKIVAVK